MFVRKFEGETLDEALQLVKRELGPDAIILKTVTNKGLAGAFKKSRIEITAAISEQSYSKKAKVDHVLSDEQQESFYREPATNINKQYNSYESNQPTASGKAGYGNMGLNKVVNSVSKASKKIQHSLDDFLTEPNSSNAGEAENLSEFLHTEEQLERVEVAQSRFETSQIEAKVEAQRAVERSEQEQVRSDMNETLKSQSHQIELLEKKLYELSAKLSEAPKEKPQARNLGHLRDTLSSLGLADKIIMRVIKKASFELSAEDLEDADVIYDFALREINGLIAVGMPLFSKSEMSDKSVVTALVSDCASGQASMAIKLAVLQENVRVIKFRVKDDSHRSQDFTQEIFDLNVVTVSTLSHLMSEARKAIAENQSLILDLRLSFSESDETKKFLEIIRRSFDNVEILTTVSAINSEVYNRKIVSKYNTFSNGVIISYVDQCLNFGSLVNLNVEFNEKPYVFFGTGAIVPDDIEAATSERILSGMFEL